jgi:hypothetical protein
MLRSLCNIPLPIPFRPALLGAFPTLWGNRFSISRKLGKCQRQRQLDKDLRAIMWRACEAPAGCSEQLAGCGAKTSCQSPSVPLAVSKHWEISLQNGTTVARNQLWHPPVLFTGRRPCSCTATVVQKSSLWQAVIMASRVPCTRKTNVIRRTMEYEFACAHPFTCRQNPFWLDLLNIDGQTTPKQACSVATCFCASVLSSGFCMMSCTPQELAFRKDDNDSGGCFLPALIRLPSCRATAACSQLGKIWVQI